MDEATMTRAMETALRTVTKEQEDKAARNAWKVLGAMVGLYGGFYVAVTINERRKRRNIKKEMKLNNKAKKA